MQKIVFLLIIGMLLVGCDTREAANIKDLPVSIRWQYECVATNFDNSVVRFGVFYKSWDTAAGRGGLGHDLVVRMTDEEYQSICGR